MHGMLGDGEKLGQSPEGIFLIQVHEQDGSDLTHPLAVAHLLVGSSKGRFSSNVSANGSNYS